MPPLERMKRMHEQRKYIGERCTGGQTDVGRVCSKSHITVKEPNLDETDDFKYTECGLKLTRSDYYTVPPLGHLKSNYKQRNYLVEKFTVGRRNFGSVCFEGSVDVNNLNLDEIVSIEHRQISLYPKEDQKPPVGFGLNRPAQVKLDRVWPVNRNSGEPITNPVGIRLSEFVEKLKKLNEEACAEFINYIPQTGSWIFKVEHFSKYGLFDTDDEDDDVTDKNLPAKPLDATKKLSEDASKAQGKQPAKQLQLQREVGSPAKPDFQDLSTMMPQSSSTPFHLPSGTRSTAPAATTVAEVHDYNEGDETEEAEFHPPLFPGSAAKHLNVDDFNRCGISQEKILLMQKSFFPKDQEMNDDEEDLVDIHTSGRSRGHQPHANIHRGYDSPAENRKILRGFPKYFLNIERSPPKRKTIGGHLQPHSSLSPVDYGAISYGSPMDYSITSAMSPMDYEITQKYSSSFYGIDFNKRTEIEKEIDRSANAVTPEQNVSAYIFKYRSRAIPLGMTTVGTVGARSIRDTSFYKGYSFRVGWGPGNVFLKLTTQQCVSSARIESNIEDLENFICGRPEDDVSGHVVQRIRLRGGSKDNVAAEVMDYLEKHLLVQLENSEFYVDKDVPGIKPKPGNGSVTSHHQVRKERMITGPFEDYSNDVWSLCSSLWGPMPDYEPFAGTHWNLMRRKDCFSDWLRSSVRPSVNEEVKNILNSDGDRASINTSAIWSLMTGDAVVEACSLAQTNGDNFLTILLTQMGTSAFVKFLMREQFCLWNDVGADQFLQRDRIKLYLLLCGVPICRVDDETINVCEGLDWKRALGLHLWFLTSEVLSIKDAFICYKKAFIPENIEDMYAKPPVPSHMDDDYIIELEGSSKIFDLCYHIIHLYCDRYYPLAQIYDPITHTTDPFDYRLSWFVFVALYAIGYRHISEQSASKIHTSFAAQLESYGMWHWALFVMLHINKARSRYGAVLKLLERNLDITDDEEYIKKETFVKEKLKIPEEWIFRIKAIRAASQNKFQVAVHYFNKAKEFSLAHNVLMKHLAPTYMINEEYGILEALLEPMLEATKNENINNWNKGGEIILVYLNVIQRVNNVLDNLDNIDTYELESLEPELVRLCLMLPRFLEPTNLHRLCKNDISKRVFDLVGQFAELNKKDRSRYRMLLYLTMTLPMADSFARKERELLLNNTPLYDEFLFV